MGNEGGVNRALRLGEGWTPVGGGDGELKYSQCYSLNALTAFFADKENVNKIWDDLKIQAIKNMTL